jgi:hypothetical protein
VPLLEKQIQDKAVGTEVNCSQDRIDRSQRARLRNDTTEVKKMETGSRSRKKALEKAKATVSMKERDVQAVERELDADKKRVGRYRDVQYGKKEKGTGKKGMIQEK